MKSVPKIDILFYKVSNSSFGIVFVKFLEVFP